jgi:hypothetical protein
MIKKLLLCLLLSSTAFGAEQQISFETLKGGVDVITASKLSPEYAPFGGILNVRTDRYGQITTRNGLVKYNTTPLASTAKAKGLFTFTRNDGTSYLIQDSSATVSYSSGGGSFNSLVTTATVAGYRHDFTVAGNSLFGTNGIDLGWSWNTSVLTHYTALNSTGYPKGAYIETWLRRNWIAGDVEHPSRLYYSETDDYANYQNYLDIAPDDGDIITGMFVSNGILYVTKTRATYYIYQYEIGGFTYVQISNVIGCVANTCMVTFRGLPTWLSARGVEQLNGLTFNEPPLSDSISEYIKTLPQLVANQSTWMQDTASDWGAGSGVNVDTTTQAGSVVMVASSSTPLSQSMSNINSAWPWKSYTLRQKVVPSVDTTVGRLELKFSPAGNTNTLTISLRDSSMAAMASSDVVISDPDPFASKNYGISFAPITLSAGATYYICVSSVAGQSYLGNSPGLKQGEASPTLESSPYTGIWTGNPYAFYYVFYGSSTASYTSQILSASSWGSWGTFSVSDVQPVGGSITYYAITSTSTYNLSTNKPFLLTNGGLINSTVGPYLKIISSFTCADPTVVPKVNQFVVRYFSSARDNVPYMTVYDDQLLLAVQSPSASTNDTVLVCQTDDTWTKDSIGVCGYATYRGNLYSGSSSTGGYVYQNYVKDVYSDDGAGYPYYWTSKPLSLHPYGKVLFRSLWVQAENSGNYTCTIGYRFDQSAGAYTYNSFSLSASAPVWRRLQFPLKTGRAIQFTIGDFTGTPGSHFRINRLHLVYSDVLELQ